MLQLFNERFGRFFVKSQKQTETINNSSKDKSEAFSEEITCKDKSEAFSEEITCKDKCEAFSEEITCKDKSEAFSEKITCKNKSEAFSEEITCKKKSETVVQPYDLKTIKSKPFIEKATIILCYLKLQKYHNNQNINLINELDSKINLLINGINITTNNIAYYNQIIDSIIDKIELYKI
jgi:hypothetical protein